MRESEVLNPWDAITIREVDLTSIYARPSHPTPERLADIDGERYVEAPENGIDMLLVALVSRGAVIRSPVPDGYPPVQVRRRQRDGRWTTEEQAMSTDDRAFVYSNIDDFLQRAHVEPRPHGFAWFLKIPEGYPSYRSLFKNVVACHRAEDDPLALRKAISDSLVGISF